MSVEDIFPEGEEGRVILEAPDEDQDAMAISRWVNFEPSNFSLEPREQKDVRFTIDVPEEANPGGHYVGLIAETKGGQADGTGVGINQRIASLVLLTVPGEMDESLSTVGFDTFESYYEYGPIGFEARFENNGTVHLQPEATISIENIFGNEVAEIDVERRNVLPGATRRLRAQWDETLLWGPVYNATIRGSYGSGYPIEQKTITFWVFPWKYGLAGLLVLFLFFLTRKRWITIIKILIFGEKALSGQ